MTPQFIGITMSNNSTNEFFQSTPYRSANERAKRDISEAVNKPLMVRVLVYELDHDKPVRDRVLDYNDHNMRHWVERTIVWATCNNMTIELLNVRDDK